MISAPGGGGGPPWPSRYHRRMTLRSCLRPLLLLAAVASLLASALSPSHAEGLPDLGDTSRAILTPAQERRIGESAIIEIRRDPSFLDDAEVNAYLNRIGQKLAAQSDEARQGFEFFALRDSTLNAFAIPGGYIGVHSGLILATETESELASVLAHEISHVTQHHIARLFSNQGTGQIATIASILVAVLAARSNPDLAAGAMMAGQAAGIQNYLNYSRDFEREADRLGLNLLERGGFDVRAMETFFGRLQKYSRLYENGAPGYLRTHPLSTERMSDMGNRIQGRPYKQVADSLEFLLVRAKLRAAVGAPQDAIAEFEALLRERKYAGNEAPLHYGLAQAALRGGNVDLAEREVAALRRLKVEMPMIDTLAARVRQQAGDSAGAIKLLRAAQQRYPAERGVVYALVELLERSGASTDALKLISDDLMNYPADARMHELQALTYAKLGKRLQQHRAQAEAYALLGQLALAIEQMELAQKAGDGNFYEQSQVDARLRELRARLAEQAKQPKS